jgi:hypothetical protein
VKKVVLSIIDCDSIYSKTRIVESCKRRIKTFSVLPGPKKYGRLQRNLVVGRDPFDSVNLAAAVVIGQRRDNCKLKV